ncbi:hypothetical protein QUA42_02645 [Microcoleus sp. Pol11C2]|uniref:hypothetical protein n=1 Tax=Microcoleus sp. Pol11C2 TaxID=3055389 RepID=UPI002FD674CE
MTPEESLEKMQAASDRFYNDAVRTNCHTFIEFTGLLNEFIKVCRENLAQGRDFTQISAHSSEEPLKIKEHQIQYMNEKLHCIFQGAIMMEARHAVNSVTDSTMVTELTAPPVDDSPLDPISIYQPRGTAPETCRKYYRLSYKDGGRVRHVHVRGGNTDSPIAQAKVAEVRSLLAAGIPPAEIAAMLRRPCTNSLPSCD